MAESETEVEIVGVVDWLCVEVCDRDKVIVDEPDFDLLDDADTLPLTVCEGEILTVDDGVFVSVELTDKVTDRVSKRDFDNVIS